MAELLFFGFHASKGTTAVPDTVLDGKYDRHDRMYRHQGELRAGGEARQGDESFPGAL